MMSAIGCWQTPKRSYFNDTLLQWVLLQALCAVKMSN